MIHGPRDFGVPWLRYRLLRHLLPAPVAVPIDFERIASAGKPDEIWRLLGDKVGASHPLTPDNVIRAVAHRLSYNMEDLVVRVDNCLEHGPGHFADVLSDFWVPLSEGVQAYWNEHPREKRYGQLWGLFFSEYPTANDRELQMAPALQIAGQHRRFLKVLESTRNFSQDEIKEFLTLAGTQILTEDHRPDLNAVDRDDPFFFKSLEIFAGSRGGRPKEVLEMICKFSGASISLLIPKLLSLEI